MDAVLLKPADFGEVAQGDEGDDLEGGEVGVGPDGLGEVPAKAAVDIEVHEGDIVGRIA